MIYKILHKLFGWDYVYWKSSEDSGIARVLVDAEVKPYYWRYKNTKFMIKILNKNEVTWLTCKPEKYFKEIK